MSGAAARARGRAALAAGDPVAAVAHFEQAVQVNLRLGHRPAVMLSRAELAEALVARAGPGDLTRARTELASAVGEARAMGMTRQAETWVAQAIALQSPATPAVLSRIGTEGWAVRCGGRRIDLPDLVGMRYLARLLAHPGQDVTAVELTNAGNAPERARTAVRKALTRAVGAITAADPVLGGELRAAVSTGAVCRYLPACPARPWHVRSGQ